MTHFVTQGVVACGRRPRRHSILRVTADAKMVTCDACESTYAWRRAFYGDAWNDPPAHDRILRGIERIDLDRTENEIATR